MSPIRGPLSTLFAAAVMLILLVSIFGCGNDDLSTPEVGFGTVEIKMPSEKIGANWHLYGPGDSFRHGDSEVILHDMPTGQYTIIWTAVPEWTNPGPAVLTLKANATLTLYGEYLDKAPGSNFVRIESADFIMGSDDGDRRYLQSGDTLAYPAEIGRDQDEGRHRVQISYAHYIGKTEITNQEFVELGNWALNIDPPLATTTDTTMLDALDGSTAELINFAFEDTPIDIQEGVLRLKKPEFANRPLIEVTWFGAASYCDWLSLQEELTRAYDHSDWTLVSPNYRLPAEAEWENACRAGTQTAFSSGEIQNGGCNEPALDGTGWFCGNAGDSSHDVGTKAENPWGLSDMHGNVWEWCHDYYGLYEVPDIPLDPDSPDPDHPVPLMFYEDDDLIPVVNPSGPVEGELRIIRSGRWLLSSAMCRSAGRMMGTPDYRGFHIGFRVAYQEPTSP